MNGRTQVIVFFLGCAVCTVLLAGWILSLRPTRDKTANHWLPAIVCLAVAIWCAVVARLRAVDGLSIDFFLATAGWVTLLAIGTVVARAFNATTAHWGVVLVVATGSVALAVGCLMIAAAMSAAV